MPESLTHCTPRWYSVVLCKVVSFSIICVVSSTVQGYLLTCHKANCSQLPEQHQKEPSRSLFNVPVTLNLLHWFLCQIGVTQANSLTVNRNLRSPRASSRMEYIKHYLILLNIRLVAHNIRVFHGAFAPPRLAKAASLWRSSQLRLAMITQTHPTRSALLRQK